MTLLDSENKSHQALCMSKLRTHLKELLQQRGMTAAQLARASGVSKQTLSYWLGGGEPRGLEQLRRVATVLETTIDQLCFGEQIPQKNQKQPTDTIASLFGDEWISGVFEIKIRRIKNEK